MTVINIEHEKDIHDCVDRVIGEVSKDERKRIILLVYMEQCFHCVNFLKQDTGVWHTILDDLDSNSKKRKIIIKCNVDILNEFNNALVEKNKQCYKINQLVASTHGLTGVPALFRIKQNGKIVNMEKDMSNVNNVREFMKIKKVK